MNDDLLRRITTDPKQCGGRPCIRGMRIRVVDVLDMLSGGMSVDEILADFPYLERDDVRAAAAFAAQRVDHPIINAAE